jgi:hypothetical protein
MTQIDVLVEWNNDIGYIHIVVKYSNDDEVNTYGIYELVCFTCVSLKGLSSHKKVSELFVPSY